MPTCSAMVGTTQTLTEGCPLFVWLHAQVLRVPLSALGRRWEVKNNELLQEIPMTLARESCMTFRAEPDYAYVVVPYSG